MSSFESSSKIIPVSRDRVDELLEMGYSIDAIVDMLKIVVVEVKDETP